MSSATGKANLLLNGDFSDGGDHWEEEGPQVVFEKGFCVMERESFVKQTVTVTSGGEYRFSANMRTENGCAAKATVWANSSEIGSVSLGSGQKWTVEYFTFTAPDHTKDLTVKLEANDGPSGKLGSFFDDVRLEKR